jgi:hypothetical protein
MCRSWPLGMGILQKKSCAACSQPTSQCVIDSSRNQRMCYTMCTQQRRETSITRRQPPPSPFQVVIRLRAFAVSGNEMLERMQEHRRCWGKRKNCTRSVSKPLSVTPSLSQMRAVYPVLQTHICRLQTYDFELEQLFDRRLTICSNSSHPGRRHMTVSSSRRAGTVKPYSNRPTTISTSDTNPSE